MTRKAKKAKMLPRMPKMRWDPRAKRSARKDNPAAMGLSMSASAAAKNQLSCRSGGRGSERTGQALHNGGGDPTGSLSVVGDEIEITAKMAVEVSVPSLGHE